MGVGAPEWARGRERHPWGVRRASLCFPSRSPLSPPPHHPLPTQSVIELSRTQDEEVGDGTTSVIILAGELLSAAEPLLDRRVHPTVLIRGYAAAQAAALEAVRALAFDVDVTDRDAMLRVLRACVGTKYSSRVGADIPTLALDAVSIVAVPTPPGSNAPPDVDVKRYAKVEKIPGGDVSDCRVLKGVMFNKDVVAPGRMARTLRNPRILLLDCALEYKKGESQTSVELTNEEDWSALLAQEEAAVKAQCDTIAALRPDLLITEKGLSDLAVHHLTKAGIAAIRRLRKTDNNRIARAVGATIVHRRRGSDGGRHRHGRRPFRSRQAGGRVLHVYCGLCGAESVHCPPARRVQRRVERSGTQPGRRPRRRPQPVPLPPPGAGWRRRRDGGRGGLRARGVRRRVGRSRRARCRGPRPGSYPPHPGRQLWRQRHPNGDRAAGQARGREGWGW